MSFFNTAKNDDASIKKEVDTLGGGRAVDSDIYLMTIKMAYGIEAESEAKGLVVIATTPDGVDVENTLWFQSGKEKGNKTYSEKDGVKQFLPGFNQSESLCLLTTGKSLADQEVEEKMVQIYNSKAKAKVATKVPVLVDLLGKQIYIAVEKQTVDKTVKIEGTNKYEPTGETREQNEFAKMFRERDKLSKAEIEGEKTEPEFYDLWLAKNKGKVINKSKGKAGAGTEGAPGQGTPGGVSKPTKTLFS